MSEFKDVVIVSGVRLPVGSFGGSLKTVSAIDMGAMVVKEAVNRAGIQPSDVNEVIVGTGRRDRPGRIRRTRSQPEGRHAQGVHRLLRKPPVRIQSAGHRRRCYGNPDRFCRRCGRCGTENISQLPYYVKDARWGARMGHKTFEDGVIDILTWPLDGNHNGVTAENVAAKYHVSREEQDAFALQSHQRACAAIKAGKFKDEILPVELKDRKGNVTIFDTGRKAREKARPSRNWQDSAPAL